MKVYQNSFRRAKFSPFLTALCSAVIMEGIVKTFISVKEYCCGASAGRNETLSLISTEKDKDKSKLTAVANLEKLTFQGSALQIMLEMKLFKGYLKPTAEILTLSFLEGRRS